jgi:hypothetical protein
MPKCIAEQGYSPPKRKVNSVCGGTIPVQSAKLAALVPDCSS